MDTMPETAGSPPLPRATVVVVAFNGASDLARCLPSVLSADETNHVRRVVVVDNASSDGSAAVAAGYPGVEVIRLDENRGFTGGNNVAIRAAVDRGEEYVVLLNQDTLVEPGWLDELVRVAEQNPNAGAVQSLLTLYPDTATVNSWGNEMTYLGFGFAGGNGEPATSAPTHVREVAYPSGAAALLRVRALRQVGLLWQELFMYHEDFELGARLWISGWKVLVAPASVVRHAYEFKKGIQKFYFIERNRWMVTLAYWRWPTVLAMLPMLLLVELGQWLFAARHGFLLRRMALLYDVAVRHGSEIVRQRRTVQSLRRVSDRAMLGRCGGAVRYQGFASATLALANPVMVAYRWLILSVVWW